MPHDPRPKRCDPKIRNPSIDLAAHHFRRLGATCLSRSDSRLHESVPLENPSCHAASRRRGKYCAWRPKANQFGDQGFESIRYYSKLLTPVLIGTRLLEATVNICYCHDERRPCRTDTPQGRRGSPAKFVPAQNDEPTYADQDVASRLF